MTGGKIALLITGIVVALLGLAALAGGTALLVLNHTARDSAGFFSTAAEPFAADSYALVSDDANVGTDGPDWLFEKGRLATVRLLGSNADSSREVFIGIGPTRRVRDYLAGTAYTTVRNFELDPFRADYLRSDGSSAPAAPTDQSFWSASASGQGRQTVTWDVRKGNWSVVVMNADASRGVDVRLSVGAKVGFIFWVGLGFAIVGGVLLVLGGFLIYFGVRRRTEPAGAPTLTAP
ncbi:MAG: hypothetical protein H0W87_05980 [Actinobacteria bacterium]|nr:hypothetical protein [Actinomycetota bacterium]